MMDTSRGGRQVDAPPGTLPAVEDAAAASEPSKRRPAWRVWLRRLGPWVVAGGVIAYLLTQYSVQEIVAEMGRGNTVGLAPIVLGLAVANVFVIALADWLVIHGLLGEPGYFSVLRGKAAVGLLNIVHYAAGHGSYAVWIARRGGTNALTAAGVLLFIMSSELTSVCVVATIAVWLGGEGVPGAIRVAAPIIAGVLLFLKAIGPLRLLGDRSPRVFHPWSNLSRARAFGQVLVRTGQIYMVVIGIWLGMWVFGIEVPLWACAVYVPVMLLVGAMPVNVAGFGAVQAVWLLFTPWAEGEQILAFAFLWQVMFGVAMILRGLPFVRRVVAEIDAGRSSS